MSKRQYHTARSTRTSGRGAWVCVTSSKSYTGHEGDISTKSQLKDAHHSEAEVPLAQAQLSPVAAVLSILWSIWVTSQEEKGKMAVLSCGIYGPNDTSLPCIKPHESLCTFLTGPPCDLH